MAGIKQAIVAAAATAVVAIVPVTPAAADGRGIGHMHPWGIGRGLIGAVVGLATLPLVIASAVVSAGEQAAPPAPAYGAGPPPGYGAGAYGYAPPPQAYPVPPVYYAPRAAYYPPAYGYYSAPRYYAPRGYYAAGPAYRQRGYAYPHR